MNIEFECQGMAMQASARIISPAMPARTTGHPDTWSEAEPAEIEIDELRVWEKTDGPWVHLYNAAFLLDSDLIADIEAAALAAVDAQDQREIDQHWKKREYAKYPD